MGVHLKRLLVALLPLALWACAGSQTAPPAEVVNGGGASLPPVTVFYRRASTDFQQACDTFDQQSITHHCQSNEMTLEQLQAALVATGRFADVLRADDDVPFRLSFALLDYDHENAAEIGSAALSGATLLVLPMHISRELKVEASLSWFGQLLKTYTFSIDDERWVSLFTLQKDYQPLLASAIADELTQRLLAEPEVFSAEHLARVLGSTDYPGELTMPTEVAGFSMAASRQFHHPFLGMQFRYLRLAEFEDFADVFVYPIRQADLGNRVAIFAQETQNIEQEIVDLLAAEDFLAPEFSDVLPFETATGDAAVSFSVDYSDVLDNHYRSRIYLAIKQDKFVKVRHTGLDSDPAQDRMNAFTQALLGAVQIPAESRFMAAVRANWRKEAGAGAGAITP